MSAATDAELERVLAYDLGKHSISREAQAAALAEARRLASRVEISLSIAEKQGLPRCKDADDQIFLELALAARADVLVSKDRALLALNRRHARAAPFRIRTPRAFDEMP